MFLLLLLGPISTPLKRGGSPYSQYDILGPEGLGGSLQGSSDSWQRTPGNKMGTKTGTSSWPPGKYYFRNNIIMLHTYFTYSEFPDFWLIW